MGWQWVEKSDSKKNKNERILKFEIYVTIIIIFNIYNIQY